MEAMDVIWERVESRHNRGWLQLQTAIRFKENNNKKEHVRLGRRQTYAFFRQPVKVGIET